MRESRGDLDLALEARAIDGSRDARVDGLDRDLAAVAQVVGEVDGPHPAAPDLTDDAIAAPQLLGKLRVGEQRRVGDGRRLREEVVGQLARREERHQLGGEVGVAAARALDPLLSLVGTDLQRRIEQWVELAPLLAGQRCAAHLPAVAKLRCWPVCDGGSLSAR